MWSRYHLTARLKFRAQPSKSTSPLRRQPAQHWIHLCDNCRSLPLIHIQPSPYKSQTALTVAKINISSRDQFKTQLKEYQRSVLVSGASLYVFVIQSWCCIARLFRSPQLSFSTAIESLLKILCLLL